MCQACSEHKGFPSAAARRAWFASMRPAWCDTVNDPIPEHMKPQMYPGSVSLGITLHHPLR
jgi:hypothetical protein